MLCALHIQVRDWDKATGSDRIGVVEIPLAELQPNKKVKKWYEIALREDLKVRQMKKNVKNSDNPEKERKCAAIEVELEVDFSKVGDFASHFTVLQPPAPKEEEFDMDILYANAIELQNNLWPLIEVIMCINPVLLWTDPFTSGLVLIVFIECCLHTWVIPVLMQLLLIRYICWHYVFYRWGIEQGSRPKATNLSKKQPDKSADKDAVELARIKEQKKKERDAHLNGFLTSVAESSLSAAKYTETLKYTQATLGLVNQWLKLVQEFLSWKYPSISASILGVLVATTVYSCFFSFAYVALVLGVAVLCIFTVPMAVVIWLIQGSAFYATSRAYIVAEFMEMLEERYRVWRSTGTAGAGNSDAPAAAVRDESGGDGDAKESTGSRAAARDQIDNQGSGNGSSEAAAALEFARTDSEYSLPSSDEESQENGRSDSDGSATGRSRGGRKGKPPLGGGKERKRSFFKKLFNVDKKDHDKDADAPKDADVEFSRSASRKVPVDSPSKSKDAAAKKVFDAM